ncbi:MAG: chitobiase/beta-hexosaminidase C-terminal domain-containing protein [Bacteroidales bacterium]|nr:chitobiase/beta-hexosaminidase C-terminal domain-containing protein [Bacteroidales bacterium]
MIQTDGMTGHPLGFSTFPRTMLKRSLLVAALLLLCASGVKAQTNYVFYNATYGYLYNDNGTLKSGDLRFDQSSAWRASGNLGTTRRNIRSYTDATMYLNANGALGNSTDSWRGDNYLQYRANRTNYYFKATSATTFTTNNDQANGNRYTYYTVTVSNNASISTNPTINGADVLTATGNSNYTATGAAYRIGYTNYNFNNADHYVDVNGNSFTGTPANATLTNAWSLESNSYATVNSTSGVVTVNTLPQSDVTLTLTLTVTATGGTPTAPNGTTLTGTKEITIQGTKPSAPIISVSGNSATLSTDAAGATTIRYTLDGSNPTASTGTVYGGAIDLSGSTSSPVTIKAVTVRSGNVSDVTEQSVTLTLPEPVITVNADAGTATITSSVAGATIYYTTNGSDPTTSSSQYSGSLSGLAAMTTIKAIAVKDGWNNSPVASEMVTIPSGVSGGTVTLFDYEDHNWTYYSGVDASVDGGNYNTNYEGKLYSPNPRNVKITYKANGGAVSVDESETEFVYYKTLEQGTTAGQYPYTVISNPFSKRPNGKGFGGWRIKEGADYISGYADEAVLPLDAEIVFTNLPYPSVNCTSAEIELEATWVNLNNITYATNNNNITYNVTGGNYETNILVLNRNVTGTITTTSPVTIMMVEPDGSSDYRGTYTFSGNITPNNNGVTKIEFTRWNSQNTVNAGYRNLWIGRGMTTTSRCANLITGYNGTGTVASPQYSIKVESGTYQYFDFYKGHSTYNSGTDNTGFTVTGTAANAKITMGNDYDRAKGANSTLEFIYGPMFGYSGNFSDRGNRENKHTLDLIVKSGTIGSTFFMEGTNTATYLQGGAGQCMYLSSAGSQTNVGTRNVVIEGGDICSIGGGIDSYNNAPSNNNTPSTTTNYERLSFNLRIKGGTIHGNVYGGAAKSPSGGSRVMVMTGGQVKGWFAAGCNGTDNDGGQNYGTSYVYIGGNAAVDSEGSTKVLGYANGGNVYAAGAGRQGATTCGEMTFGSNLVIADDSYIERGVYGGGNYGYSLDETYIYITGGTNEGNDGTVNSVTTKGGVYGGANQQDGPDVNMYMTGGTMKGGVYGGCNTQGTISGNVTMQINGGQVGTDSQTANIHGGGYGSATRVSQNVDITLGATGQTTPGVTVYGDVYGGSALGYVNGTAATNTYHTYVTMNKGVINGSLYGGGLGDNNTAANVYGPVQVKVYGGSVKKTDANGANGSGGVYGANNVNGAPQRSVEVDIYGTDPAPSENEYALFAVYGGGNAADYTYGNGYPTVTVHGCDNSIEYVYGGGNAARVEATDVTIYGGNVIGNVFGGGNGTVTAANVTGNTLTKIYGGTILRVFGGSNSQGTIGGTITVNAESRTESGTNPLTGAAFERCPIQVGELYGGGNMANSNVGAINIGCMEDGDMIDYVYGGANQADITGNINLEMTGGRVGNLFGGNNTSGDISGTITVTVNWNGTCSDSYLGNVFGGGNLATYTGSPTVNVYNGTVSGNVYGGGAGELVDGAQRGVKGKVTGNPSVTIGDDNGSHTAIVLGDVYGGGDAADVDGVPVIVVNDCSTQVGNLYGGGNAADIEGSSITVNGGTIGDAFGGGHGDKDASNPSKYADVNGDVTFNVYGGTIARVFAGSNSRGTITGTSALTINKTGSCDMKIGEVYGGGNEAAGVASTVNIGCTGTLVALAGGDRYGYAQEGIGYVYGGANQADIGTSETPSNIVININSGIVANVFGGNNTSGDIYGTITVNIEKDNNASCASDWYVGNVFGGGNLATYTGSPVVNIKNGTVSGNVYGAGKGDPSATGDQVGVPGSVTGNPTVTVGDNTVGHEAYVAVVEGDVYGGGDAAKVVGNTTVNFPKSNSTAAKLFGGGNAADVTGTATVNISDGTVTAGVYGGCNSQGSVDGTIAVNITGGTIGAANSLANVHGGGYGEATETAGNVNVTINGADVNIYGDVYGGSALGNVNDEITDATTVTLTAGTVNGNIYGGGLGDAENAALVNGTADVVINGGTVTGNVFGANNVNGTPKGAVTVTVNGTDIPVSGYALAEVYGGGNMANYSPTVVTTPATVVVNGCDNSIGYVYGGGNAADVPATSVTVYGGNIGTVFGGGHGDKDAEPATEANVSGDVTVNIHGGTIGQVFGGSNSKGTISGEVSVLVEKTGLCAMKIGEVYGGGNQADGNAGSVTIGCTGDWTTTGDKNHTNANTTDNRIGYELEGIGTVFGGANNANIGTSENHSDITLSINSGMVANVFGGNNNGGTIYGDITVNIEKTSDGCGWYVGNVYGAGNLAPYSGTPEVYIKNGEVSINVYGGGKGASAVVTGDPSVVIGDANAGYSAIVGGDVYGGGDAAGVTGNTSVTYNDANASSHVGRLFGGGNAAGVSGTVGVTLTNGQVNGGVYGGCNASGSVGAVVIALNGGQVGATGSGNEADVYGGGYGASTTTTDDIAVTLNGTTVYGDLYGGSALGGVNASTSNTTTVTLSSATLHGSIFGGGKGDDSTTATSEGNTVVNINTYDQYLTGIYGGANVRGLVKGDIAVNINANVGADGNRLDVFGGGYGAATSTNGHVTVTVGDESGSLLPVVYGDVYGGSALGSVNDAVEDITTVNFLNGTLHGNVYGGGLGAATLDANGYIASVETEAVVNGTVHVNIGSSTQVSNSVTIDGNVFGCNNLAGSPAGHVYVDVYHTGHTLADACPSFGSDPSSFDQVPAQAAYAIAQVYGGGNLAHYTTSLEGASTHVHIHNCDNTIEYVYGGGNAANTPANAVTVDGGRLYFVFGGGNGAGTGNPGANIAGDAQVMLNGGIIDKVFGGSNTKGIVRGVSSIDFSESPVCTRLVGEVYGGGNQAPGGSVNMTIPCGTSGTGVLFGGSRNADMGTEEDFKAGRPVTLTLTVLGGDFDEVFGGNNEGGTIWGNVVLNLKGGTIVDAYGGNNAGGNIAGTITVNVIDDEDTDCPLILTNVYGGGKNAAYTPADASINSPMVNVLHKKSGTSITGDVFGGGLGEPAVVTANPVVTVGDVSAGHESRIATVAGNIYGGGSMASVTGYTSVLMQKDNSSVGGSIFGAGKGSEDDAAAAVVTESASVTMTGGSVGLSIYGGGEMASVGVYTRDGEGLVTGVDATKGTTTVAVSGGTVGPDDISPVDINGHGNVFGGGLGKAGYHAWAYVTNAVVNLSGGTVRGSVFGGGENGHVSKDTRVTVSGGTVGVRIPHRYRDISSDNGSSNPVYAGNVYGGGRGIDRTTVGNHLSVTAGQVYGNTNVSVTGGHIRHSVYGGGSLAMVGTYTITTDHTVFGGNVHNFTENTGNATVSVSGGRIGPSWDDLLYDEAGNRLVDASGNPLSSYPYGGSAGAADTIAQNFECLGENEGMVYGSGRGVNFPNDDNVDHELYVELAFTNNTHVTVSGTAEVVGSVFGGGENGHVKNHTQVDIQGGTIGGLRLHHNGFYLPDYPSVFIPDSDDSDDEMEIDNNGTGKVIFRGNVYGGGRGVDHTSASDPTTAQLIFSISAGRVYGNTQVNVTGGNILHNVFGGGSIASVGTYTYPLVDGQPDFLNSSPTGCWPNTGKTEVNISGGQVGQMGENEGYVYGGGRGVAGASNAQVTHMAFVNETEVNILSDETNNTHADVRASVFGGGMNGHVLGDTHVTVSGGVVGGKTAADYGSYDTEKFPVENRPAVADTTIHGIAYYSGIIAGDTITRTDGTGPATVYLGNVYGGGRGVDHYGVSNTNLSATAGRVYGNTHLTVTGGIIYHSIFGGGSIASVGSYTTYSAGEAAADLAEEERYRIVEGQPKASVSGGLATVVVSGGRIGTNGRNNGRVFGSSRGMAGVNYRGLGYVNIAHVTISGGFVRGAVFGSGENGHVLDSTLVMVSGGHVGNGKRHGEYTWINNYVGNVYGGGRGLDRTIENSTTVSPFAGRVFGSTNVVVSGGHIHQNVYGGGSLASVGRYKRYMADPESERYNTITYADADKGTCYVTVTGGIIGIDGDNNGHVFGSSRGTATTFRDIRASLAYTADSRVSIEGGRIFGSVFGGGESGHVQRNAHVSVSGGEIGIAIPKDYDSCTEEEKALYDLAGNVYGAGRGIDQVVSGDNKGYSMSAGYVRGNTLVTITGGTIHRNVYGGGSMGSVGDYGPYCRLNFWQADPASFSRGTAANSYADAGNGVATVVIKGGVGTSDGVAHGYGGNVFGSCRGEANDPSHDSSLDEFYDDGGFAEMAYVTGSHVIVETGAMVYGNVYGGGENGHVDFGGTLVDVLNGTVNGHVFGGGKGSTTSPTAGIVDGPAQVNVGTAGQVSNTVVIGGDVFAGNDTYSSPLGVMQVDVYRTAHTSGVNTVADDGYALNAVYGGGNLAHVLTGVAATDFSGTIYDDYYISERLEATDSNPAGYYPWPGIVGGVRKSVVRIHGCENTIDYVYGGGNAADCLETEVVVEGGRIGHVFGGGHGDQEALGSGHSDVSANVRGNSSVDIQGGTIAQVFAGSNVNGSIAGEIGLTIDKKSDCDMKLGEVYGGGNLAASKAATVTIGCTGTWTTAGANNHTNANTTDNRIGYELEGIWAVYGGANQADVITGDIVLDINSGIVANVFGGNNTSGSIAGTITVNIEKDDDADCASDWYVGNVFGGGNLAAYEGSPAVNIKNGTVSGNVYGGGNGDPEDDTQIQGSTAAPVVTVGDLLVDAYQAIVLGEVYGGGNAAKVTGLAAPTVLIPNKCNTEVGYVYGGGNAADVPATNVTIAGGTVHHDVFGGGHGDQAGLGSGHSDKQANVTGDASVVVTGGKIDRVFAGGNINGSITGTVTLNIDKAADANCDMMIGEAYGGGNMAASKAGNLTIGCTGAWTTTGTNNHTNANTTDNRIGYELEGIGSVYGGANQADVTAGDIVLDINSGMVANVFGGNNTSGSISGNITVNIEKTGESADCGWYVGNVFGGGNLAAYTGDPVVNVKNGTVSGNVFGGGKGLASDHTKGQVTGNPLVTIGDNASGHESYVAVVSGDVYGGGDAGNVVGTPVVNVVNKCNTTIANVYGGGNAADVGGTDVNIDGGTVTGMVFGGGHGDAEASPQKEANVSGNVSVEVTGGTINKVFGGSNSKGNITGTVAVNIAKDDNSCELHITEVYGGGNVAAGNAGTITIGCTGGETEGIGDVYGGANAADINSDITLNITGGKINRVFGGNNASGTINGGVEVNVNWSGSCDQNSIQNVYGAGNQAPYTVPGGKTLAVNILNGTISQNVYGGGLGEPAVVTGNPTVTVGDPTEGHESYVATVAGSVFGGGDAAAVTGNPTVYTWNDNTTAASVFGGGNLAAVTGSTDVEIGAGTVGTVYGGGNEAGVSADAAVILVGGQVTGGLYGGCNTSGSIGGNTVVTLTGGQMGTDASATANVHGGGYGPATGVDGNVTVNVGVQDGSTAATVYGDVYGGSALGNVNTNTDNTTQVNLYKGTVYGNVYGGGLGDATHAALVNGNVKVVLDGVAFGISYGEDDQHNTIPVNGRVFGCNNINGTPKGLVQVVVNRTVPVGGGAHETGTYEVQAVYGGGNLAAYDPAEPSTSYSEVIVNGCDVASIEYVYGGGNAAPVPASEVHILGTFEIDYVFGGGNGKDRIFKNGIWMANPGADVGIIDQAAYTGNTSSGRYGKGRAHTEILGGIIHHVFGGSNTLGNVVDSAIVTLGDQDLATCEFVVDEVFGAGNEAYMAGVAQIDMKCIPGIMSAVYGGSRLADIHNDVVLNITGGHYRRVFGGNDQAGNIYGSITVNIEETGCLPIIIGELYGGGNQADYSVYGYNDDGTLKRPGVDGVTIADSVYSHPQINVKSATRIGTVYGGGLEALVVGNPHVNINMCQGWVNGVYEPADGATGDVNDTEHYDESFKYKDATDLELGTIGTVFGGGNRADVIGDTYVNVGTQTQISLETLTTDTENPDYETLNPLHYTNPRKVVGANILGNVYGGGNQANVTGKTHVTVGRESGE